MSSEFSDKQDISQAVSEVPTSDAEKRIAERSAGQESGLSRKARLSAYFTIAAAAFGLISDGCEYSLSLFRLILYCPRPARCCMSMTMKPLLITSVDTDQNNLMTMTNVSL